MERVKGGRMGNGHGDPGMKVLWKGLKVVG